MLTPVVVKIGGSQLDDPAWLGRFAAAAAGMGPMTVVHGGGRAITACQEKLGVPVIKRDGIRVTTPEVACVVRDVLCGTVREAILGPMAAAGMDPVGIAGVDGFLETELVDPARLGRVGRVAGVDAEELRTLMRAGKTPVLAPISLAPDGGLVNVNADEAASAVARALGARELLFVSDVPGVLRDGRRIGRIAPSEIDGLILAGVVTEGMVAKLLAARAAEVGAIRIGDLEMLGSPTAGTSIALGARRSAA